MAHYKRDPYALALYKMGQGIFVNAVSVNDPDSTCIVWEDLQKKLGEKAGKLILIVCNRADRGSRTRDMLTVCERLAPVEVWLAGSHKGYMTQDTAPLPFQPGSALHRVEIFWERIMQSFLLSGTVR